MNINTNIIYLENHIDNFSYRHQRNKILAIAENKFRCRDKAEQWMTSIHPIMEICPQSLLGTHLGYCVIKDFINYEKSHWVAK